MTPRRRRLILLIAGLNVALASTIGSAVLASRARWRHARALAERAAHRPDTERARAIDDYRAALALEPDGPDTLGCWLALSCLLAGTHDLEGALDASEQAVAFAPDRAGAWAQRGLVRCERREPALAVTDLVRATELEPTQAAFWVMLGNAELAAGEPPAALTRFEKALALAPGLVHAEYGRVVACAKLGRGDEALARASLLSTRLEWELGHDLLAWIHLQRHDPGAALVVCNELIAVAERPRIRSRRAEVWRALGCEAAAVADEQRMAVTGLVPQR